MKARVGSSRDANKGTQIMAGSKVEDLASLEAKIER